MRNGNIDYVCSSWVFWCSVLTVPMRNGNYRSMAHLPQSTIVLTVPMRNGNRWKHHQKTLQNFQFLPYLWGMETSCSILVHLSALLTFLPYLWGMEPARLVTPSIFATSCSYRTYEEWKLPELLKNPPKICSYRTYEEWKPRVVFWFISQHC